MDVLTLAVEQLGGILAAAVVCLLLRPVQLGALGILVVGLVGGALGGLILMQYAGAASIARAAGEPDALAVNFLAAHVASGAAGGAALALVTGFLTSRRKD